MEIKIHRNQATEIGFAKLEPFGLKAGEWNWKKNQFIDLRKLDDKSRVKLAGVLETARDVRGVRIMLKDLATFEKVRKNPSSAKVRNVRHFAPMLQRYLFKTPGHRVYTKDVAWGGSWLGFYVNNIRFIPQSKYDKAHVQVQLVHEEFGNNSAHELRFYKQHVRRKSIAEILSINGLYPETTDLRETYLEDLKTYTTVVNDVGRQFLAEGFGTTDLDGNHKMRDAERSTYYRHSAKTVQLEHEGLPSRVVIDMFSESDKQEKESKLELDETFWLKTLKVTDAGRDEDDDDAEDLDEEVENELEELEEKGEKITIEVPTHPIVVVFDLRRHLRLKTHVANLTEYTYDEALADKLVLPEESKHLVEILIAHQSGGFKDIVVGKGGGAIVMLSGPPGTGKTLTAEVYAESEKKALYSVQASQLGVDAEELEAELMRALARAKRWGAVMLLDEADVYVYQRGSDLNQNAIVGVFLRVLEYHSSILFLTTNRPENVDDAIASRCIARINYTVPSTEDQAKIWRVLADGSDIELEDREVAKIVKANERLSGRDVKNLLKLASLVSRDQEGKALPVTAKNVEFVKQFKPTLDVKA